MARKTDSVSIVEGLAFVAHLPEVGTVRDDLTMLRVKLDRLAELRRQVSQIENDVLRSADRLHSDVARMWTAAEIESAKTASRGRS